MRIRNCLVFLLLISSGCALPYLRDSSHEEVITDYSPELLTIVRERVKTVLKSPATAQFSEEKVFGNKEKRQIIITGTVDSQNSYGAMLRGYYQFIFVQKPDGSQMSSGAFYDRDGNMTDIF